VPCHSARRGLAIDGAMAVHGSRGQGVCRHAAREIAEYRLGPRTEVAGLPGGCIQRDRDTEPMRGSWVHIGRLWTNGEPFLAVDAALRDAWHGCSNDDEFDQLVELGPENTSIPVGAGRAVLVGGDGVVRDDSWIEVFEAASGLVAIVQAAGPDYPGALARALDHPDAEDECSRPRTPRTRPPAARRRRVHVAAGPPRPSRRCPSRRCRSGGSRCSRCAARSRAAHRRSVTTGRGRSPRPASPPAPARRRARGPGAGR
jgi:hypothetical protein